jgi:hypothetical protein
MEAAGSFKGLVSVPRLHDLTSHRTIFVTHAASCPSIGILAVPVIQEKLDFNLLYLKQKWKGACGNYNCSYIITVLKFDKLLPLLDRINTRTQ